VDKSLRPGKLTRRALLIYSAAAGATSLLAACLSESAPQTTAPTAKQQSGATLPPAAALSTPTANQAPRTQGKFTLGKLEGAQVIDDPAQYPKTFKEAPELATLVQQGKLSKIEERIGQDPLVLKPVESVGKYAATLRKALFGNAQSETTVYRFATGPTSLLFWDATRSKVVPNIARGFDLSPDGKTVTISLRRGMKWSDGQPFTADDILFWYEDIYQNKQLYPGTSADLVIGGKDVVIQKIDQYTVRYVSPEPNPIMAERLASPNNDIGGPAFRLGQTPSRGGYAPKHYLSQFHPKYVAGGQDAVDKMAKDAQFNGWVPFFVDRATFQLNPDLPVTMPWKVTVPMNNPTQFVMERNPYSVWVDTEGNQLPYIGKLQYTSAQNLEVIATRAIAGDFDFQENVLDVSKLPVLIDGQARGEYKIYLDPGQAGIGIALNLAYDEDPEVGDWIRNVDFRRALSLGIDRDQINETFFLGTGIPSSPAPVEDNKYFPGEEWRTRWATLDVAQGNGLLDKVGLTQKDSDGYRLRKDGKGRLRLIFTGVARIGIDFSALAEMIRQHWQRIGIELIVDSVASNLAQQRIAANQVQMLGNAVGTEDVYLFTGTLTPGGGGYSAVMGIPYGQWQATGGKQGKEPFPELKQAMDLLEKGKTASDTDRIAIGKQLYQLHIDNVFSIGLVSGDLAQNGVRLAKTTLGNVPARIISSNLLLSPSNAYAQTFYFK
jgi:peptide/nickel transport system substrate-binding protein